jgi:hypothetical protein
MPRRRSHKYRKNKNKKHTCLRTRRRTRRQRGGYGFITKPEPELVSKYVGDEGMGVPTIVEERLD